MDWYRVHHKAFTDVQCAAILARAMLYPAHVGKIGHGGENVVDEKMRRSTIRWIGREDWELQWVFLRIERMMLQSNAEAFGFDIAGQCGGFVDVQFTEYHAEGEQHYDWHEDNAWKKKSPFDRKLSMVIQLSKPEDYEGGRLELANDPLPDGMFKNQGDVIIFPSFNRHRVTPITRGCRYSLVTWFIGPKLR